MLGCRRENPKSKIEIPKSIGAGATEPQRKGVLFVYLWLGFFLLAFLVQVFRPDFKLPGELSRIVLQVLGIFFGSRASKYVFEGRTSTGGDLPELTDRHERVLALAQERGQLTNREAAEALHVSTATAKRLLADLTRLGHLRPEGVGRGIYYVPAKPGDPVAPSDTKQAR